MHHTQGEGGPPAILGVDGGDAAQGMGGGEGKASPADPTAVELTMAEGQVRLCHVA